MKKKKSKHTESNIRHLIFIAQLRKRPLQRSLLLNTSLRLDDSLNCHVEELDDKRITEKANARYRSPTAKA